MTQSAQPTLTLNDGREMPQLGLGVWQAPNEVVAEVVRTALAAGYRAVDTAMIYHNEDGVGEGLKAAEHPVFVTTKVWNDDQGYDSTLRAFDLSMKKLDLNVLDLYLIHWPAPRKDLYVESWKALIRLREEGRVRSIGVSNFNADHLERIIGETGVTPAVNQIELHPRFQQTALRAANARLGVLTQSWSPLGQGRLLADPALAVIAEKHGKTIAQVILRWHIENGLLVIPKSVTAERVRANIDVFDFALDPDDLARIAALDDAGGRIGADPMTAPF